MKLYIIAAIAAALAGYLAGSMSLPAGKSDVRAKAQVIEWRV